MSKTPAGEAKQYTVYLPNARREKREPFDPHAQGHGGWFWDEKDFSYVHHASDKRVIWEDAVTSGVVLINGWLVQELAGGSGDAQDPPRQEGPGQGP